MLRNAGVLYILTWKCASGHSGVHFFISHIATWLCTRRFRESSFRPSVLRDFPSRTCIFFLLTLSLSSILLSSTSLLCFSSLHIVGSLTSKLPLMTTTIVVSKYWCYFYYCYCCTISDTVTVVLYYSYYLHFTLLPLLLLWPLIPLPFTLHSPWPL